MDALAKLFGRSASGDEVDDAAAKAMKSASDGAARKPIGMLGDELASASSKGDGAPPGAPAAKNGEEAAAEAAEAGVNSEEALKAGQQLADSAKRADEVAAGQQSRNADGSLADGTTPTQQGRFARVQEAFANLDPKYKATGYSFLLGGLGVAAWAIHLGILTDQNNGADIKVLKILVHKDGGSGSNKLVTIIYDPNDAYTRGGVGGLGHTKISPMYVRVCKNDLIKCNKYIETTGQTYFKVEKVYTNDNAFDILVPSSDLNAALPSTINDPVRGYDPTKDYSLDVSNEDPTVRITISTTFNNQLANNMKENLGILFNLIKDAADLAIDTATDTFCEIVPDFVCDTKTWLIVGGILLGLFILFILLQVVNRKK